MGETNILVIGATGRIGAEVARVLRSRARVVVRRSIGHPDEIVVEDYVALPLTAFSGIDRVVNCVGISVGTTELLHRVNVDIAMRLANAARTAGVRQFIHISSFSVYGGATRINRSVPPGPTSEYGRTKLMADDALAALAQPDFAVALLRLPLVYTHGSLGKLGKLLRLWRCLRLLPVPADDVCRAMIGAELSAEVVAKLVALPPSSGIMFAADAQSFTYQNAAKARSEKLWMLTLPQVVIRLARQTVPALTDRLFADSRLDDADNLAVRFGLPSQLYRDIATARL